MKLHEAFVKTLDPAYDCCDCLKVGRTGECFCDLASLLASS